MDHHFYLRYSVKEEELGYVGCQKYGRDSETVMFGREVEWRKPHESKL